MRKRNVQLFVALLISVATSTVVPTFARANETSLHPAKEGPLPALKIGSAERSQLLGIASTGSRFVAVGVYGIIVTSSDGEQWQQVTSPADVALTAVKFSDAQHGWAVGHDALILGTQDGGSTWQVQSYQPELFTPLFALQPIDAQTVLAVGAFGTIKRTQDGGKSWLDVDAPDVTESKLHLNAIARLPSGSFVVSGEQGLVGTSPDGVHWKRAAIPYEGSFFGAAPLGERGAVVFGMRGTVYASADIERGDWRKVETNTTASFFGYETGNDGNVLIVGSDGVILALDSTLRPKRLPADHAIQGQTLTGAIATQGRLIVVGDAGARSIRMH